MILLVISKKFKLFPETYLFFLKSKNFLEILRKLPSSVAFHSKIATFSHFKVNSFFGESMYFFKTAKNLNVLRNLTNSFALYSKFVTISDFWKFQVFFGKRIFFRKKHSFWTFWEISMFPSHSTSNWLTVSIAADIKNVQNFSENLSVFIKKLKFFELLGKLPILVQIKLKLFCKTLVIVLQKPKVWTFWEILLFQLLSTANLIPLVFLKNFKVFFSEHPIFLAKTQLPNVLRNLTVSVAVDTKLANFSCFQKFKFLFRKKTIYF